MRNALSALIFLNLLLAADGWAQGQKEAPALKSKEAREKFTKTTTAESFTLPAKKPEQPESARYAPAGKRDPFRSLALKAKVSPRQRENLSPLERYELGQLKLVGIVWDVQEPKAVVEDGAGLGYIVKVGTPIGPNNGKITAIKPTEVVIEEIYIDFYGARKSQEITMRLPVEP